MIFGTFIKKKLLLTTCLVLCPIKSFAQVIPDNTLGAENSVIRSIDDLQDRIEGGAIRGKNLFHSFEQFSIPEGFIIDFANPEGITNVFSRVTGENISEIFGSLGVDGAANLFLMNSNGIVFGENAAINVNGSFLATTAQKIEFNDGSKFSSVDLDKLSLTIDVPIGLGFGSNPGSINVNDKGHNLIFSGAETVPTVRSSVSPGLETSSGKNFALFGGEININGGVIVAEGGQIELGSIKKGFVNFDSSLWRFDYSDVSSFGDINLTNTSLLDASSTNISSFDIFNSEINIKGQNIAIKDESVALIQNQSSSAVGEINLDAIDSITISKVKLDPVAATPGGLISETLGNAEGSDINVSASNITLLEGGSIISKTLGLKKSGDIYVEAFNELTLTGVSINDVPPIASNITNAAFPVGKTGSIDVKTSSLKLQDGATITNFVAGQAVGDRISIDADDIEVSGTNSSSGFSASSISTNSSGLSQAADISINTSNLKIENGAAIASLTFDFANPGNININASNLIKVQGLNPQTKNSSSIASTVFIQTEESREAFASLGVEFELNTTGDSGNVNINTPELKVTDGASVTVLNQGMGDGGELQIDAEDISLDNSGSISASTATGEGGNIMLNTESLELLDDSQISASAGGLGDGGNININSNTIFGSGNISIDANAASGTGGNIQIETRGLFLFPDSTIEASSELGIDGTVRINTLDTNLQKDLEASLLNLIVDEDSLANSCLVRRNQGQGSFVINSGSSLSTMGELEFYDSGSITGVGDSFSSDEVEQLPIAKSQSSENLIPAQQVVKTENGKIFLVSAPGSIKSLICN